MTCLPGQLPKYRCGVTATDCPSDNCDGTGIFDTKQDCIDSGCGGGVFDKGTIPTDIILFVGAAIGLLIITFTKKGKKGK